jgi:hypothetical protein
MVPKMILGLRTTMIETHQWVISWFGSRTQVRLTQNVFTISISSLHVNWFHPWQFILGKFWTRWKKKMYSFVTIGMSLKKITTMTTCTTLLAHITDSQSNSSKNHRRFKEWLQIFKIRQTWSSINVVSFSLSYICAVLFWDEKQSQQYQLCGCLLTEMYVSKSSQISMFETLYDVVWQPSKTQKCTSIVSQRELHSCSAWSSTGTK